MLIVMERIGSHLTQVTGNATNGKVHLCQFVSGIGIFLTIDRHVLLVAVVRLYELHALHKHTARAAAGVIYLAAVRLYHLGYEVDDGLWRVEFALALAFGYGEIAEEVLIDPAYEVILAVLQRVSFVY